MAQGWTVDGIDDLSGKVAIVTGANSGIGLEVSRVLARNGARVVLACRSERRSRAAMTSIQFGHPGARIEARPLDLASLESIHRFAHAFLATHARLDLLVNNAGVMLVPYGLTEDGFELHMGTNHLGHFALTGLLMDRLLETSGSRIVSVTSAAYRFGRREFDRLTTNRRSGYSAFRAYARSKLANLVFTQELQRRLSGTGTLAVAAHPGGAATDLGRRMTARRLYRTLLPLLEWLSQSAKDGASSVLRAATDPRATGGSCYGPAGLLGMRGRPVVRPVNQRYIKPNSALRLWQRSEALTRVRFLSGATGT